MIPERSSRRHDAIAARPAPTHPVTHPSADCALLCTRPRKARARKRPANEHLSHTEDARSDARPRGAARQPPDGRTYAAASAPSPSPPLAAASIRRALSSSPPGPPPKGPPAPPCHPHRPRIASHRPRRGGGRRRRCCAAGGDG
eukprot:scaffold2535_cov336-Prasinococcus_capsulatus_cf.AAC.7